MPETTVIDTQTLENLRALNPGDNDEFVREIAGIFFEDTPLRIAELDESLRAGDVLRFVRAAHSIKGSSANLAPRLFDPRRRNLNTSRGRRGSAP
ncbi:MAG: Hpt domain-containing protein [Opitutus sp.]|nr:Hpt domain-containing protein [Opitutus sp.]